MPAQEPPVSSLGEFINQVSKHRESWGLAKHKELWFRGENKDYEETILRPELYRPEMTNEGAKPLKRISVLLDIENDLHEEFKRCAVERCDERISEEDWEWDSYFLMQHHAGPTRLLDWSDGALMALHFAVRNKKYDDCDARVYVLEPSRLMDKLNELPDLKVLKQDWKSYCEKHPSYDLTEDEWENAYLPADEETNAEMNVPRPPLVLDFPLITRRIAAQRSRFIVFGTEPNWLSDEFKQADSTTAVIKAIRISANERPKIRQQLRDCGITESVIYPDLDGLGREMKQLWEDRRSAAEENS